MLRNQDLILRWDLIAENASNFDFDKVIRLFFVLFCLGLAYSFPIWLADRYCIDDLGRSTGGYLGWDQGARPFANWLQSIANFQYPGRNSAHLISSSAHLIVDTSPLLQIISIGILTAASTLLAIRLSGETLDYSIALIVFPVIGSPFLLENLSYKFDALSMSAALGFSIVAAIGLKNKKWDLVVGTLLLTGAYGLYQPAINAFIGTSALLVLAELWNDGVFAHKVYRNITKFAIASLIYKLIVLSLTPPQTSPYVLRHSELISANIDGFRTFLSNFSNAASYVAEFFLDIPLLSIFGIASIAFFGSKIIYRGALHRDKLFNLAIFVVSASILTFSIFGLLLFLKIPIIIPRTLMGFTIFLVFLLFCFKTAFRGYGRVVDLCLLCPIYYLFFLAFAYGAAAKAQTQYDYSLASSIIQNLDNFGFRRENVLVFDGSQPRSPVLENSKHIAIIDRLVQLYIKNQWMWGYVFMQQQGLQFTTLQLPSEEILTICKRKPILVTERYEIYKDENTFIVAFHNGICAG